MGSRLRGASVFGPATSIAGEPMNVLGVGHVTFVVGDPDRMARFLCDGLGAESGYDSGERSFSLSREKFFVLGRVFH